MGQKLNYWWPDELLSHMMAWLYWHVNDRNISVLEIRVWKPVDDVIPGSLSLLKWIWIKDRVFRHEFSNFSEVTVNSRLNEILSECTRILMSHIESSCVIMRRHKSSAVTMLTPRDSRWLLMTLGHSPGGTVTHHHWRWLIFGYQKI